MKNLLMACFMAVLALGVTVGDAEAARLGGSKSFGMQRQSVAPRPASPMQQATPVAPPVAPAAAPAVAPKRNWMGPLPVLLPDSASARCFRTSAWAGGWATS